MRLRPHAKTHKSPVVARWQIERGAVGICCAKVGEAEVFADAGIDDIRLPYPVNPSNADARARADGSRVDLDHRRSPRRRARLVRRDAARRTHARRAGQGRRRLPSLRHRPGRASALGVHPARSRRCRGCGCAACSATPATATTRRRRTSCAAIARQEAEMLVGAARRGAARPASRSTSSRSARRRRCASAPAARPHRAAARQLRLLRPHAGGARRRDARRLRADGARDRGRRRRRADRIILDCGSKTLTNDQARGITAAPGLRRGARRTATRRARSTRR